MTDFKILSDAQHLRLRPQMYIGSVSLEPCVGIFFGKQTTLNVVPGLLKIINEIIDNSVDEFIRTKGKFANKIRVSINPLNNIDSDWQVIVDDNGRGIPLVKHGDTDDTYQPVLAWTKAKAGSNFGSDRDTIGANGIGSYCTNVFSKEFIGETSNGTDKLTLVCVNEGTIKSIKVKPSKHQGTVVSFIPELDPFGLTEITQDHLTFIRDRLENLAMCYPGLQFWFNDEKIVGKSAKEYASRFAETYVIAQDTKNILIFAPSGTNEEFLLHSYVNGLWIKNGGSHIDFVLDKVVATVREHVKKKHKIDVLPNAIKSHLLFVNISRDFRNLKFDSQTKERITNTRSEVEEQFNIDFDKIAKQILNTEEIIDPMISAILNKKELEERRALAKKQKQNSKLRVVNHIAATSKNVEEKMLCIAEGLSAIGMLLNVRDPLKVGGYPLKGKVMNVRDMKPVDIVKNKEISELMSVIGLEFGEKATELNYGKIAIMTDADVDGSHIFCLLLNLFSNWSELFEEGRVYRLLTPLYYCTKGKDVKMFYDKESFDSFDSKGYTVEYFKGLGTMPKDVYRECINNPRLVRVTIDDIKNLDTLEMAFGGDSQVRKDWLLK